MYQEDLDFDIGNVDDARIRKSRQDNSMPTYEKHGELFILQHKGFVYTAVSERRIKEILNDLLSKK